MLKVKREILADSQIIGRSIGEGKRGREGLRRGFEEGETDLRA